MGRERWWLEREKQNTQKINHERGWRGVCANQTKHHPEKNTRFESTTRNVTLEKEGSHAKKR